jgi:hypothetical protein
MITETHPKPPPVQGGNIIETFTFEVRNFRIYKVLAAMSRLCFGLLESGTNNTSSSVSGIDARNIQRAYVDTLREWTWAKEHRDDPEANREYNRTLQFPEDREIQSMLSVPLQSIAMELGHAFQVFLGLQDAKHQLWVSDDSVGDGDKIMAALKGAIDALVGTGAVAPGAAETGEDTANFDYVGRIQPPISTPQVVIQEPATDVLPPTVPDAPDTPSVTVR